MADRPLTASGAVSGRAPRRVRSRRSVPTESFLRTVKHFCGSIHILLAGGGAFDCKDPPTGIGTGGLVADASGTLPQYERHSNTRLLIIACKGAAGEVIPLLNHGGKTGCY